MNKLRFQLVTTVLLFSVLSSIGPSAYSSDRFALVIGNSDYKESSLKNPVNDAEDISELLESGGFSVTKLLNSNRREMEVGIRKFTRSLTRDSIGLFYFAGHGIQLDGSNYLIPVGVDIQSEEDVRYESVNLGRLVDGMKFANNGLNMIILDACRNNPYSRRFRSFSRGLTKTAPASGTLIMYATEPGKVAADGQGRNGLFTQYLLSELRVPNAPVESAFKKVASKVKQESGGEQIPWIEGVLLGEFSIYPKSIASDIDSTVDSGTTNPNASAANFDTTMEFEFWRSIDNCGTKVCYEDYLLKFPAGVFAVVAKERIREMSSAQAQDQLQTSANTLDNLFVSDGSESKYLSETDPEEAIASYQESGSTLSGLFDGKATKLVGTFLQPNKHSADNMQISIDPNQALENSAIIGTVTSHVLAANFQHIAECDGASVKLKESDGLVLVEFNGGVRCRGSGKLNITSTELKGSVLFRGPRSGWAKLNLEVN